MRASLVRLLPAVLSPIAIACDRGTGPSGGAESPPTEIVASVEAAGCPTGIALRGSRGLVTRWCEDGVSVLDAAARAVSPAAGTSSRPVEVALDPSGTFAYVANSAGLSLTRVRFATGQAESGIPLRGRQALDVLVSRDGARIWVGTQQGVLYGIDVATSTIVDSVVLASPVIGLAESPDGRTVYAGGASNGTVHALRRSDLGIVRTYPVATNLHEIALSPDGRTLYVSGGLDGVAFLDLGSGDADWLALGGAEAKGLALSPRGEWLAVATPDDGAVHVVRTGSRALVKRVTMEGEPWDVAIPDGSRAIVTDRAGFIRFLQ